MDDDYGDDAAFTAAAFALESSASASSKAPQPTASKPPQPTPPIIQPTPIALPARHAPTAILVSPRQKGNPILKLISALPWEYADIASDYALGQTTCCLFLSLKYHRLHPEYIYSRIRLLAQTYNLRLLLAMVDIENHEAALRELAKTSLVNNLTLVLCWSAREAARYLELYKQYEHAGAGAIRQRQGEGYAERVVEFVTGVRSVNRADAVGLVSAFGTVRGAVNARGEEVAGVSGWGEKKVVRWCGTVREGFRVRRAGRRGVRGKGAEGTGEGPGREDSLFEDGEEAEGGVGEGSAAAVAVGTPIPVGRIPTREASALGQVRQTGTPDAEKRPAKRIAEEVMEWEPGDDEEEAFLLAAAEADGTSVGQRGGARAEVTSTAKKNRAGGPGLSDGVAAALAKLRQN